MSAHTPGPWEALKQGTEIQSSEGCHEVVATVNGIPVNIAMMFEGSFSESRPDLDADPEYVISKEEAYANALLIAAAPRMLAALKGVLPFLTGDYWPGDIADPATDYAIAVVREMERGA